VAGEGRESTRDDVRDSTRSPRGLLDRAKELAPDGLTLFTHQGNERARAFYERRGFRAVAFGVSPPPESEPDVKYAWRSAEDG
jgi:ribosomal protein S18 acetylase RimI-like enzyme